MRLEELSFQERLWKAGRVVVWGLKPAALYLFLPPLLTSVGLVLFGGRTAQKVLSDSGNFYYALGILGTVCLLYRRSQKRGSSLWQESGLELVRPDRKRAGLLLAAGFLLAVAFSAAITVIPLPPGLKESYHSSSQAVNKGTDQILALVSTVLLAPVAEEIVFRGYMLGRFLTWFRPRQAIGLSAAVFAVCHVSPLWVLYAWVMGILLAWVSIREDNTLYSVVLHIGFNLSVVPVDFINENPVWKEFLFGSGLRVAFLGGTAFLLAVWALCWYGKEEII